MYLRLLRYFISLYWWDRQPVEKVRAMQIKKFKKLFEFAKENSEFYKKLYKEAGVYDLNIQTYEDINKLPVIDKSLLKKHDYQEILTVPIDAKKLNIHSTSGSTGEPFKLYFNKYEDYTAHCRVLYSLMKEGYSPFKKLTMISRYESNESFQIENELGLLRRLQQKCKLFKRDIISIYEPPDQVIDKILESPPDILWTTPSILQIIAIRLKERNLNFNIPNLFVTSENISKTQNTLFRNYVSKRIIEHYGLMECPTIALSNNDPFIKRVFSNSVVIEYLDIKERGENLFGKPIITNLVNYTMPIIRYDTRDDGYIIQNEKDFPIKVIGPILGRQDDILDIGKGNKLAHHHVAEMFMDFHEVDMYRFIKKNNIVTLQLKANEKCKLSNKEIENLAIERWNKRFLGIALNIEFVDNFKVDKKTGKFRNMISYDN